MHIDIETRFITLIGTPLAQSFAARMQNAAYNAMDSNILYFYTETDNSHLGEIIQGIRYMPSIIGCAITKPNKVEVLQYLDELDPLCKKMGACNTIVKTSEGKLIGYNTDGLGFYRSITEEAGIQIEGNSFFCFGAGGAGRGICPVLAYHKAKKVYITDIVSQYAETLVEDINTNFAPVAEAIPYGDFAKTTFCDVIINASGVGMGKTIGQSPFPSAYMSPKQLYYDACYNPDKTQFLIDAEAKGGKILNGLGMSLYQGVVQIELWTGKSAPVETMRKELLQILKEKSWTQNHSGSEIFNKQ